MKKSESGIVRENKKIDLQGLTGDAILIIRHEIFKERKVIGVKWGRWARYGGC